MIRIGDIDSIDQVTDFESAADHTINLQKYQQLNLPLTRRSESSDGSSNTNVFDSSVDNTNGDNLSPTQGRWKFKGPIMATQKEGEFQDYLRNIVKVQREAFIKFIRRRYETMVKVSNANEGVQRAFQFEDTKMDLSDAAFERHLRALRQDEEQMSSLIEHFFDLPTNYAIDPSSRLDYLEPPPKTHLSAGLSYLKSAAHIANDPVKGPQPLPKPLQARVLKPAMRENEKAILGLGGFVIEDSRRAIYKIDESKGLRTLDTDVPGGTKVHIHARKALMGSDGRVDIHSERSSEKALRAYRMEPIKTLGEVQKAAEAEKKQKARQAQAGGRHISEKGGEELGSLIPKSVRSNSESGPRNGSDDAMDLLGLITGSSH